MGLVLGQCPRRDIGKRCSKMCGRLRALVTSMFVSFLPHIHARLWTQPFPLTLKSFLFEVMLEIEPRALCI